jgi:CheY-like chemotaxis protein
MPQSPGLREREIRLEAQKQLVRRLIHDFNNVLAPVLGYATMLKEDLAGGTTAMRYADNLESVARRAEKTHEAILYAMRPQRRFRPRAADFEALIRAETRAWHASVPTTENIQLECELVPATYVLDENHWREMIEHLLENARKAMAGGGKVLVSLRREAVSTEQAAELGLSGRDVFRLTVRDNGCGMAPDVLSQACDPYFNARSKGKSNGLGLTFAHGVARLHGGQLELASAPEAGTTVTLWLPVNGLEGDDTGPATPAAAVPNASPTCRRVLLVDDDPMIRQIGVELLQRMKVDVQTATDGEEGLQLFLASKDKSPLLVTDISMPRLNGLEMLAKIQEQGPLPPVLIITGERGDHSTQMKKLFGDAPPQVLRKPFSAQDFWEAIKPYLS